MHRHSKLGFIVGAAGILLSAGCKPGLDVVNPNQPDIPRALASSTDVKALASGSVNTWYLGSTAVEPWIMFSVTSDAGTMNFGNFGARFNNLEPRIAYGNSSAGGDKAVAESPWQFNYRALGAANKAIKAFKGGLQLSSQAETDKYRRLAQFTQAATLTNLALIFDKAFLVDENTVAGTPLTLSGYKAVSTDAVARWAALAADATGKSDVYDKADMNLSVGTLTSAKLARIANTYAALTLAYTPRNAAEAATVDWPKVLQYADKGIGTGSAGAPFDFTIEGDFNTWYSDFLDYSTSPSWVNVDQRLINMMDANVPAKFNGTKVAPTYAGNDHRLETDFTFTNSVVGDPNRGIWMQSPYYHSRYDYYSFEGETEEVGPAPYILAAENDLVKAEAIIRTGGNFQTAADLINTTRVGRGQLAPASGTETAASLLAKIAYERDIELHNTNGWMLFTRRHVDGLQPGTIHHLPIPASELETLGLPVYTFGGVGKEQSINMADDGSYSNAVIRALSGPATRSLVLPDGSTMEIPVIDRTHSTRARRR
jgi:starch-binding outer membrane protein, SusD/RagB family